MLAFDDRLHHYLLMSDQRSSPGESRLSLEARNAVLVVCLLSREPSPWKLGTLSLAVVTWKLRRLLGDIVLVKEGSPRKLGTLSLAVVPWKLRTLLGDRVLVREGSLGS